MRSYEILEKKRNGGEMTPEELAFWVRGVTDGSIPDYQIAAWLMAVCLRGMTPRETARLTQEMARSGGTADLSGIPGCKVDKHSTGGIGDKTTLVAGPLAAALGVKIPKMSGRGLGFTGGTIDKLESIPGLRTSLPQEEFCRIVREVGISITAQTGDLAPADKKLYALRDVTATVDSLPLIASSIMSKKLAAGADAILLDVKAGSGAFMKTPEDAAALAQAMVSIGTHAGKRTAALITDMDRPLGNAVGNALEVAEACETLRGRGPEDLTWLSLELAAGMLSLAEKGDHRTCLALAKQALRDGSGFEKLCEMVAAQGGNLSVLEDPSRLPQAAVMFEWKAAQDGYWQHADAQACGAAAVVLGAGRETKESAIDPCAGIVFRKKPGAAVSAGETLACLYSSSEASCRAAARLLDGACRFGLRPPEPRPLIFARVTRDGVFPVCELDKA